MPVDETRTFKPLVVTCISASLEVSPEDKPLARTSKDLVCVYGQCLQFRRYISYQGASELYENVRPGKKRNEANVHRRI
jgi:hypothetical protein